MENFIINDHFMHQNSHFTACFQNSVSMGAFQIQLPQVPFCEDFTQGTELWTWFRRQNVYVSQSIPLYCTRLYPFISNLQFAVIKRRFNSQTLIWIDPGLQIVKAYATHLQKKKSIEIPHLKRSTLFLQQASSLFKKNWIFFSTDFFFKNRLYLRPIAKPDSKNGPKTYIASSCAYPK